MAHLISRSLLAGAALLAACAGANAAALHVVFVQPDTYTDAGYRSALPSDKERSQVRQDLGEHLAKLAERLLAPDQTLKIEVLDIDLAGRIDPRSDLRVVTDVTPPRIRLRYALARNGQPVAGGEEVLSDLNFMTPGNRYSSGDRLRYEKALLDAWFEARIAQPRS